MNQLIGKYEILSELGRGGFGTVYLARDTVLDVERALKVLHPILIADPTFLARFKQEARLAAKLDHPNLVPVYDFGEDQGRFYLAMKYMPGGSLKDLLEAKGHLNEVEALRIFEMAGAGVDFAHAKDVIHRDLKPRNLLFDADGSLRVSDMGFAKSLFEDHSASLSSSGAMIGTPAYMAPEIWRGKPSTLAVDIYSMGCIYYEMLTGKVLFDGDSAADVMTKHVLEGPIMDKQVPEDTQYIIRKALAKEPNERYDSIHEFIFALKRVNQTNSKNPEVVSPIEVGSRDAAAKVNTCPAEELESAESVNEGAPELENGFSSQKFSQSIILPFLEKIGHFFSSEKRRLGWLGITVILVALVILIIPKSPVQGHFTGFYYSSGVGNQEIYFLASNGSTKQITFSSGRFSNWEPVAAINGYVYFTCDRFGSKAEVCAGDASGKVTRVTTDPGQSESWQPAIATNGNIYYTSNRFGQDEILMMDRKGNAKRVFSSLSGGESWDPTPTQNGNLYFTSTRDNEKADIYAMDKYGKVERVTLSPESSESWDPTPAQNGNLYFTSNRDGQTEIYSMNGKGNVSRVTFSPAGTSSWNPIPDNLGNLYFTSDRDGTIKIYLMKENGKVYSLVSTPGNVEGRNPISNPDF